VGMPAILALPLPGAGVVLSDIIRTRLRCPSLPYWLAATAMAPVTILVLLGVREYLVSKDHKRTSALSNAPAEGDVAWTRKTTIVYPALCTFAGVVAGMFGVGGGIIKVRQHQLQQLRELAGLAELMSIQPPYLNPVFVPHEDMLSFAL
jgi:hypothetical protein